MVGASVTIAAAIVGVALFVRSDRQDRRRRAEEAAQIADANSKNVEYWRLKAEEEARAAKRAREEHAAAVSSELAASGNMDRATRDAAIRTCVSLHCPDWRRDSLVDGAPNGTERTHARLVLAGAEMTDAAKKGVDGTSFDPLPSALITAKIAQKGVGWRVFGLIPTTTIAIAKKDPDEARGGIITASGSVVEIHKARGGNMFDGAMMTSGMDVIRFVTAMSTKDIFAGSWASFVGVFVQQFDYPNVSGGQTRTLLIVGAFDLPENRRH